MGFFEAYRGQPIELADPLGMEWHRRWWMENAARLEWNLMSTFQGDDYDCVLLRAADGRWTYGCPMRGQWVRFTEGAAWPLPADFIPVEWAEVNLDDAIILGQE